MGPSRRKDPLGVASHARVDGCGMQVLRRAAYRPVGRYASCVPLGRRLPFPALAIGRKWLGL